MPYLSTSAYSRNCLMTGTTKNHAFTLIELMIAIVLSTMIIYMSIVATTLASQTVTISKQLSIENNMLRTGIYAALDELDFWDQYDDRYAPNPQNNPLRGLKKPFCPMTYDPTKKEHDPKTWWRGFGFASSNNKNLKWGDYSLLSKECHSDPIRAWYPDQISTINSTLGEYGMLDYMGGDAIYCWHKSSTSLQMKGSPRGIWEITAGTATTVNNKKDYREGEECNFLPKRPAHWPGLEMETRRYVVWSSFIDLCQIIMTNPVSGKTLHLAFWGVGTTLRGARQQRNLDTVAIK